MKNLNKKVLNKKESYYLTLTRGKESSRYSKLIKYQIYLLMKSFNIV